MVNGDGSKTAMTSSADYTASASGVKFNTTDKTFAIHYGSVNSGSDMGAITGVYQVSANCLEADVLYDYKTNAVSISETAWGQSFDDVTVTSFTAVPASVTAGNPVKVTFTIDGECDAVITATLNFDTEIPVQPLSEGNGVYSFSFTLAAEGIYTFTAGLSRGGNILDDVAKINVKVKPAAPLKERVLSVNAYEGVGIPTLGQCSAFIIRKPKTVILNPSIFKYLY